MLTGGAAGADVAVLVGNADEDGRIAVGADVGAIVLMGWGACVRVGDGRAAWVGCGVEVDGGRCVAVGLEVGVKVAGGVTVDVSDASTVGDGASAGSTAPGAHEAINALTIKMVTIRLYIASFLR